ncbi:MAG: IS6 family transposase [Chloroflexi bacterium 54-19]|nr:MAG: IS6 family transposase [Chloroflexi bacterium 54-19]
MICPFCKNTKTHLRKKLTSLGYKTYYCGKCDLTYNERTGTPFNKLSIPTDILFLVLFYRLRYKLSLRDVAEMFIERGFEFTHEAVRDWEERFAHLFSDKLKAKRKFKTDLNKSWRVDETYLKVGKSQVYLYRAIDKRGNLIDVRLSNTRDLEAAELFFKQAKETVGHNPEKVTTDGHDSYPKAIRKTLGLNVEHRTNRYVNNLVEQSHRKIKQRYYPMKNFKSFEAASRFTSAFEEVNDFFRYQTHKNEKVPLIRQRTLFKLRFADIKREFLAA